MDLGGRARARRLPAHLRHQQATATPRTIPTVRGDSMQPLLDMMLEAIPGPEIDPDAPLQMLVTNLDWSDYVGRIAVGRIYSGTIRPGQQIALMQADDESIDRQSRRGPPVRQARPRPAEEATAGDIAALVGLDDVIPVPRALQKPGCLSLRVSSALGHYWHPRASRSPPRSAPRRPAQAPRRRGEQTAMRRSTCCCWTPTYCSTSRAC